MSNTPLAVPHYAFVVSEFSDHQLTAWLSLLTPKNLNLIIEITHNILYNNDLKLTPEHKKSLSKFVDIYKSIDCKSVKNHTKYIIVQKNPKAVKLLFDVIKNIYG